MQEPTPATGPKRNSISPHTNTTIAEVTFASEDDYEKAMSLT